MVKETVIKSENGEDCYKVECKIKKVDPSELPKAPETCENCKKDLDEHVKNYHGSEESHEIGPM